MKKQKIFIVKSAKRDANAIKHGLEENGYYVDVAHNVRSGVKMFGDRKYDLVIIDMNLANENAYELCRKFRALNENIPIIFLTSFIGASEKAKGYDAGADDYIVKPFEIEELLFKIRVFLQRSMGVHPIETGILKAHDLEVNLYSKTVMRNNKTIHLTAKEFQLLEYLLRNKNKVVSRRDLALEVWDIDFDTNTNIVEVYVNYLRNKIDKNYAPKLIQTQIGMGYILKGE